MQCYAELTPPTAVSHSLSLPFLSSSANNLVVAKTSLLQIFSLKTVVAAANAGLNRNDTKSWGETQHENANGLEVSLFQSAATRGERLHTTKLVLVAQYELSGTITSLARVKILRSKSGGEALLLAVRDAKLSLIEWDPERYSISTISIHYYEREEILSSPWEPDLGECVNYLSVDPSSRCAVLKFGERHLAILPFHQVGDLIMDDEYDPDFDGEQPERKQSVSKEVPGEITNEKTPYAASFVLSLLALDPSLTHPLHLSFLYEYREPTFGILYSQVGSSTSLLHERRDNVSYAVYTLDLEQRASTTLLSVNKLPYDLLTIIPLSRFIGGALLVGGNELIHVDQSGKTNGVAVNDFAKKATTFAMLDQSDLNMRLENCVIKQLGLDNNECLIVLNTGELAVLAFKIDGRSVSGLSVRRVSLGNGGDVVLTGASCASIVGRGRMFVGCEDSDSMILGWSRRSDRLKRKRSLIEMDLDGDQDELELDEDDIDDDEDDLYGGSKPDEKPQEQATLPSSTDATDDYNFRVHDTMLNVGPIADIASRTTPKGRMETKITQRPANSIELVAASGRGRAGALMKFHSEIGANMAEKYSIDNAQSLWTVCMQRTKEGISISSASEEYDKYVVASVLTEADEEKSAAFSITPTGLEEVKETDFDPDAGTTVSVDTLNGGTRMVQVLQSELRTYDGDLGLAQIYPLTDEESDAEPKVVSASIADPYVVLIRDDSSAMVLTADESGDLDEVQRGEAMRTVKWQSGSLYEDSNDILRLDYGDDSENEEGNVLMFLLSVAGGLQVFRLPNLQKPVYVADGLSFLPPFLSPEFTIRRSSAREQLIEILVAELGDSTHKSPYLILRSANDDLVIYQPYQSPVEGSKDTNLRLLKIPNPHLPKVPAAESLDGNEKETRRPLQVVHDDSGYSRVFMPGLSPSFIVKSASSPPRVIDLCSSPVKSLSPFHTSKCRRGFLYIDCEGTVVAAQLASADHYSTGWSTQRIHLGEQVDALAYNETSDSYVLGTCHKVDFKLPDEDFHNQWSNEGTSFLPQIDQGSVKLLDSKTLKVIDKHDLDPAEIVTCIKPISLEVSEHTHERQSLVAIGTAAIRGEDLPSMGNIYIFAIIDVVPEPEYPETGHAFKLIAKEETKGMVTALSGIGTQGFLLVAQGQKCMVRGLKEDGSLLPVAFMDMQCYVSVAKELPGTGLCLMGDAVKGVWFTGYTEDPYQLRLFGKSPHPIEVIAADFLPDGKQLYMVVADADCNIHILQFDPEHPKSISGQRLLHHTTFHTGHFPTTLTLLPEASTSASVPAPILLTTQTGSLALLTPLSPSAHRTLSSLQSHLQNTLPHPLGLNPRSYRMPSLTVAAGGEGVGMGRGGVVDGNVVRRWLEGGSWRRWSGGEAGVGMDGEGEEGVRGLVWGVGGGGVF